MYTGKCHCGNVTLTIPRLTETTTSCNCSICHRYGALWGYLTCNEVQVDVGQFGLGSYEHGDKCISFKHCNQCGCVTHYTATEAWDSDRLAVNYRMFDPREVANIDVRYFDGADSWTFQD